MSHYKDPDPPFVVNVHLTLIWFVYHPQHSNSCIGTFISLKQTSILILEIILVNAIQRDGPAPELYFFIYNFSFIHDV